MNFKRRVNYFTLILLCLLSILSVAISLQVGAVYLSPEALLSYLFGNIDDPSMNLLINMRYSRVLTAFISGAILAMSGLLYQSVFQNPLVDAYVLGVASGATFGGMLFLRFGFLSPLPGAFLGALLATSLTLILGKQNGGVSIIKTLLGGVVVGSVLSAASTFLLLTWKGPLYGGLFWSLGNFASATSKDLLGLFILAVVYLSLFLLFHRSLDVLLLGEEQATSLGLRVSRFRLFILLISALAVSYVSSRFGLLGFVGLIAPHLARLVIGPLHHILLPVAFMFGGILLVSSEALARSLFVPVEIPVGIITVLIGGPFFLYLLSRKVGKK